MRQVSPLKSDSLFLPSVLSSSERCHWSQLTCTHGELRSTFLRAEHLHKLFGILWEIGLFLLFIDSCTPLFISVWTHWYLFYTLAYNPVLFKLLCCSNWIQGVLISERLGCWMVLAQERETEFGVEERWNSWFWEVSTVFCAAVGPGNCCWWHFGEVGEVEAPSLLHPLKN